MMMDVSILTVDKTSLITIIAATQKLRLLETHALIDNNESICQSCHYTSTLVYHRYLASQ